MTTRSDLAAGIAPGSLEYGARDDLVAGLQSAVGSPSPTGAPNPQVEQGPPPLDSVDDPIAALLGGQIDPGQSGNPLTSGLSVGAGPGPAGTQPQKDPKKLQLMQIATTAASPIIRAAARAELRRLVGERL